MRASRRESADGRSSLGRTMRVRADSERSATSRRAALRARIQLSARVHRSASTSSARRTASPAEMVTLGGTKMDEAARYRVIVDRISHEVEYLPRRDEARGAAGHLRHQQPVLVDGRRQVLQLLGDGEARRRHSADGPPAAEGLSGRHRPHRGITAQPRVPDRLGRRCSTTSAVRRSSSRTRAAAGSTSTRWPTSASCSKPTSARRRTA